MLVVREGPSPTRLLAGFLQPLAACAVMAAAVWLVHRAIARETSRDFLGLLKKALRRGP